jgi:hypothetical protein
MVMMLGDGCWKLEVNEHKVYSGVYIVKGKIKNFTSANFYHPAPITQPKTVRTI